MFHDVSASVRAMVAMAAIFLPTSLAAQIIFQRTYGGPNDDEGWSVQQTSDGGYVVAGWTGTWPADVYLIKTDSEGDTVWTKTFGGSGDDAGYSVRLTTDGGLIVAGYTFSYGAGYDDFYLIRTDVDGNALWARTYGGSGFDAGFSAQQTADAGFIASGFTGGEWEPALLVKTNAAGDTEWTRTFEGMYFDGVWVQQTGDGGFVLTGSSGGAKLIKVDGIGNHLWTKTYSGKGYSVQQTADGGYIVAGAVEVDAADDVYLVKTDSNGDTLWTRTYGGSDEDAGLSVQQVADGGYIVVGYTRSYGAGGSDAYVLRFDGNGNTLWTKTIGGPNSDCGTSVQLTTDGGYVIAGYTGSFGAGGTDVWLVKTDSLGNAGVVESSASPTRAHALSLSCQPNPCRGATTISFMPQASSSQPLTLRMYDSQGRMVLSREVSTSPFPLSTLDLPSGAYFIRADAGGEHATARVVLQR